MNIKNAIKEFIPPITLKLYRSIFSPVQKYYCPVCSSYVNTFRRLSNHYSDCQEEHGYIDSPLLFETLNRRAYSCVNCGAADRQRLYALFIDQFTKGKKNIDSLLYLAPSKPFVTYLKDNTCIRNVRTSDLYMDGVDDNLDICNMNTYHDGQFDFVICSHILEHINDDLRAIAELYRVLHDKGTAIIMVPINLGIQHVYENALITTPEGRWKHFGQDDHVRTYSKEGFVERMASVGFHVHQLGANYFGKDLFLKCGITEKSVLYVAQKQQIETYVNLHY